MPAIVLVSVWKDMGFFGLILLSGMVGVNRNYYEAASLDGAGAWTKFVRITLPLMTPAIFYVLVVSLINAFQLFPQIMIMTDGGPNGATQVMVERIYKYGFPLLPHGLRRGLLLAAVRDNHGLHGAADEGSGEVGEL